MHPDMERYACNMYVDCILASESIKIFNRLFSKKLVALTGQLHLGLKIK